MNYYKPIESSLLKELENANYKLISINYLLSTISTSDRVHNIMLDIKDKYLTRFNAYKNKVIRLAFRSITFSPMHTIEYDTGRVVVKDPDRKTLELLKKAKFRKEYSSITDRVSDEDDILFSNFTVKCDDYSKFHVILDHHRSVQIVMEILKKIDDCLIVSDNKIYDIIEKYVEWNTLMFFDTKLKKKDILIATNGKLKAENIELDTNNGAIRLTGHYREKDLEYLDSLGFKLDPDRSICYRAGYLSLEKFLGFISAHKDAIPVAMESTFQITDACNLCCTYCYQHNKGKRRMTLDTAKKAVDYILSTTPENCDYINPEKYEYYSIEFVGGDGLLNIDLVDSVLDYLVQRMIDLDHPWLYKWFSHISTNGVLYRDEKVQKLLAKWGVLLEVLITVDGSKELHDKCRVFPDGSGSYDLAIDAVIGERERGMNQGSKITLSPDNIDYLYDSIIDFIDKGFKHIWFNGIYEHQWTVEEARKYFYSMKKITDYLIETGLYSKIDMIVFKPENIVNTKNTKDENYCGGDGRMLAIDPDGVMFNCMRYMKSSLGDTQKELRIGDINIGIGNLDEDTSNINMLKSCTYKSQSSAECIECPISAGCGWCSAYNYELYGTPNKRSTNICNLHKAEVLANFYYHGMLNSVGDTIVDISNIKFDFDYTLFYGIIDYEDFCNIKKLYEKEE